MFPAIETADPSIGTIVNSQTGAVALPPNGTFLVGGLELAVPTQNTSIVGEEQQCTVSSPSRAGIAFDNTDDDIYICLASRFA